MRNVDTPMPDPAEVIELTIRLGRATNPSIQCVGIALNTSGLSEAQAVAAKQALATRHALPVIDPLVDGVTPILDRLLASS